jgi:hypothetical protein
VTVLADGVPYSLFGVTGEPAHRLAGWFLAVAGDQAGWDAGRRAIVAELAAATAAHRARREDAQRAVRRAADAVIGRLADRPTGAAGPEDREIAAALRRSGLAAGTPLIAVALMAGPARPSAGPWARPSPGGSPPEAAPPDPGPGSSGTAADPRPQAWPQVARVLLEEMLPGSVAGVRGGAAVALAPGGAAALDRFRDVTGELAGVYGPGVPGDVAPGQPPGSALGGYPGDAPEPSTAVPPDSLCLAFGLSMLPSGTAQHGPPAADDPAGPGAAETGWTVAGIGRALAQAHQARRVAALLGSGVRLVDAAGLGSVELLLATAPAEARLAFRASLLSPLLDYDADHGTELVRTLRVFLDCSGSWTRAAEAMFVHVNSLRYRMRRVEELTGRNLGSLADQAALLLALRLADPEC